MSVLTPAVAWQLVGGLSKPSKMPSFGYSIPARRCKVGSKLRAIAGSICSKCYALKGRYVFPNVQNALERRFQSLDNPQWVDAMVVLITAKERSGFFRWHDAGDLQSVAHLERIIEVCKRTPYIRHWLPTREYGVVSDYLKTHALPANLCVRFSEYMFGGRSRPSMSNVHRASDLTLCQRLAAKLGVQSSGASASGYSCPASGQGGKCSDCRACWNRNVAHVTYKTH